jgi:hypothetical protein
VQVSSNDSIYYYFEADSPGLSTFAITASPKGTAPTPTVCSNTCPGQSQKAYPDCSCYTPEQPPEEQPVITTVQSNNDWIIYEIIIAVITAILILYVFERAELMEYIRPSKPKK